MSRHDLHTLGLAPLMVDLATAAALCSMSPATYSKYAKKKILPPMNAAGRISVEALKLAVWRLDGIRSKVSDDPDAALAAWEAENGFN